LASAEEVDVKMGDGFATVRAVVYNDAKAGLEFEVFGYLASYEHKVTE